MYNDNAFKHGHTHPRSPEYRCWGAMVSRCRDINNKQFSDYGGRGIFVCDRWINSFIAFLEDMGEKPSPEHTLERLDNNDGYYKNNCKWATRQEQALNRRDRKRRHIGPLLKDNRFFSRIGRYNVRCPL